MIFTAFTPIFLLLLSVICAIEAALVPRFVTKVGRKDAPLIAASKVTKMTVRSRSATPDRSDLDSVLASILVTTYGTLLVLAHEKYCKRSALNLSNSGSGCPPMALVNSISEQMEIKDIKQSLSLFLKSVKSGDLNLVKLLISEKFDINAHDEDGNTALHLAAENGLIEMVTLLIERGSDVNSLNKSGQTPLIKAIVSLKFNTALILLKAKQSSASSPIHTGTIPLDIINYATKSVKSSAPLEDSFQLEADQKKLIRELYKMVRKDQEIELLQNPIAEAKLLGHHEMVEFLLNISDEAHAKN